MPTALPTMPNAVTEAAEIAEELYEGCFRAQLADYLLDIQQRTLLAMGAILGHQLYIDESQRYHHRADCAGCRIEQTVEALQVRQGEARGYGFKTTDKP